MGHYASEMGGESPHERWARKVRAKAAAEGRVPVVHIYAETYDIGDDRLDLEAWISKVETRLAALEGRTTPSARKEQS